VAKIIEQHGGKVELVDAEPDANGRVGASFVFRLPLKPPAQDEEERKEERTEGPAASAAEGTAAAATGGAKPATKLEEPQLQAVETD